MKSKLKKELLEIVDDINTRFSSLNVLSNDELREKLWGIQEQINNSEDIQKALDSFLPEVYAIVKETARRFSEGDVLVTANDFDKTLSDNFDFVGIVDDKAIYRNKWDAGGKTTAWEMIHYDEQLMGGILLHRGYAIEMATGEGKTLVATLPVFLNSLTHNGVHLMTVNDYLSKRDCELTRPIYMFYGLSADCIEYYRRCDERKKKAYAADITFGTNSSFAFDYLFDHMEVKPEACVQREHNFAIIDELDSILIDNADTPHIISGGNLYEVGKIFQDNINIIRELLENKDLYKFDKLKKSAYFTNQGKEWLKEKTDNNSLFDINRTYEIDEFDNLPSEEKDKVHRNLRLQNVLCRLLLALTVYECDVDYIVEEKRVIIIDKNTGRKKESSRWEHGLHTAIEVKENVPPENDYDSMGVISLKHYFKLYNKVCGMSGTIMSVKKELQETYNLECEQLPTHKSCIREDLPIQIFKTAEQKNVEIIKSAINYSQQGRPSLICSPSVKKSNSISELFLSEGIKFNQLNAKTAKDEASIISKAGLGDTITVSTSMAGRGTDIKPSTDAINNGGLVVIGTELFESVRIDRQLRGRTGRQGNPGTSVFYASLDDDILKYLSKRDQKKLKEAVDSVTDANYNVSEIRRFFEKAQAIMEKHSKESRKGTVKKDDIIAPHRLKFYTQRNSVLFEPSVSETIISEFIDKSNYSKESVQEHLSELYNKTRKLLIRYANNKTRREELIPFSDNLQTYTISLDLERIKEGLGYFSKEYKRQIILQIYDKQWKRFVMYTQGNLDQKEIGMLNDKYDKMMNDISSILLSRLLYATIPVEIKNEAEDSKGRETDGTPITNSRKNVINPEGYCPCGSGKKYCECHGANIHSIKRRRR